MYVAMYVALYVAINVAVYFTSLKGMLVVHA